MDGPSSSALHATAACLEMPNHVPDASNGREQGCSEHLKSADVLAKELHEHQTQLAQLNELAESLVLQVADREVTIEEQDELIQEQRELLARRAEGVTPSVAAKRPDCEEPARGTSGTVERRPLVELSVYVACAAVFAHASGILG